MTRKKFIKNITYMYSQITKKAKEDGLTSDLVRSNCLVRPKDYELPKGKTYQECWDAFVSVCGEIYGLK